MNPTHTIFHQLQPGLKIEGDWHNFPVPMNIEVGENTVIDSSSCFKKYFSQLPVGLKVGSNVTLQSSALGIEKNGHVEIGDYSYISSACIAAYDKIIIGKYVFIAGGVTIVDTDFHPLDPAMRMLDTVAISTIGDKSRRPKFDTALVIIEDDVWIAANTTIAMGVRIGKGAVIGANSFVNRDVASYSIVGGVPAQQIGARR